MEKKTELTRGYRWSRGLLIIHRKINTIILGVKSRGHLKSDPEHLKQAHIEVVKAWVFNMTIFSVLVFYPSLLNMNRLQLLKTG